MLGLKLPLILKELELSDCTTVSAAYAGFGFKNARTKNNTPRKEKTLKLKNRFFLIIAKFELKYESYNKLIIHDNPS